jgi:hypothetical protein
MTPIDPVDQDLAAHLAGIDADNAREEFLESRVEEFFTSPAGKYLQEILLPSEIEALWSSLYRAFAEEEQSHANHNP